MRYRKNEVAHRAPRSAMRRNACRHYKNNEAYDSFHINLQFYDVMINGFCIGEKTPMPRLRLQAMRQLPHCALCR